MFRFKITEDQETTITRRTMTLCLWFKITEDQETTITRRTMALCLGLK